MTVDRLAYDDRGERVGLAKRAGVDLQARTGRRRKRRREPAKRSLSAKGRGQRTLIGVVRGRSGQERGPSRGNRCGVHFDQPTDALRTAQRRSCWSAKPYLLDRRSPQRRAAVSEPDQAWTQMRIAPNTDRGTRCASATRKVHREDPARPTGWDLWISVLRLVVIRSGLHSVYHYAPSQPCGRRPNRQYGRSVASAGRRAPVTTRARSPASCCSVAEPAGTLRSRPSRASPRSANTCSRVAASVIGPR